MSMQLLFAPESEAPAVEFKTKNDVAYQALNKGRLADAPYVEAQKELERLFDKNQLKKRLKKEFDVPQFTQLYLDRNLPDWVTREFLLDLCIQMCIFKRTQASTLIGVLYRHFQDDGATLQMAMQKTATALEIAIEKDFVDYSRTREEFIVKYELLPETQREVELYQYPLPMVVQPKPIKHNRMNGYLTDSVQSLVVLKAGRQAPLYAQADLCLDNLDKLNSIPLSINQETAKLIANEWKDLDRKRPNELQADYEKRVKAFERYDSASKDVMHALTGIRDRFWLTHKYDRRGRVYCQGYHVNPQGNEWNKAVIEFADKEIVRDA